MPRLSINQLTTYRWTFDEDLYHAKRAGFDTIGIWRRKLADFGEERAAELLADEGFRVSCLSWTGGFTGADGRTQEESVADGMTALRQGARVGAECLIVYSGGRNNHITPHACRLLRQALDRLVAAAEVADVVLALKPMHPECASDWSFLTDLEKSIELLGAYDSPYLKLVYDNYHFPYLHRRPEWLADLMPHLALVQLGDARLPHGIDQLRCPLGEGLLEVRATAEALCRCGYNGAFDVELMGDEIESHNYEPLLHQVRQVLASCTENATSRGVPRAPQAPGRAEGRVR